MNCQHCHIGQYQSTKLPYMTTLDDQLLVVPNVSTYRCDICGYVQVNQAFLARLQYLLDRLTTESMTPGKAEQMAISEKLAHWQATVRNN